RKVFELELRVPDWMVHRQVDDRIFVVRKDTADLLVELFLRLQSPIIRDESETSFEEVFAQLLHLLIVEECGSRVFEQHKGALEQRLVRDPDDDIFRIR